MLPISQQRTAEPLTVVLSTRHDYTTEKKRIRLRTGERRVIQADLRNRLHRGQLPQGMTEPVADDPSKLQIVTTNGEGFDWGVANTMARMTVEVLPAAIVGEVLQVSTAVALPGGQVDQVSVSVEVISSDA